MTTPDTRAKELAGLTKAQEFAIRWTMHTGNTCPIDHDALVLVWLRNGDQFTAPERAESYSWARTNWLERLLWPRLAAFEIIAYRRAIHEPHDAE